MKKVITLILASALVALLLSACTFGTCDICGKSGVVNKKTVFGTTVYICNDCG